MGNEDSTTPLPSSARTGLPAFDESGRKGVLERLRDDKLREGDLVIIKVMGSELLKAEMWDSISKEEICQEHFDTIREGLLESIDHSTGQKKGDYVSSEVVDELASEIVESIMSAFVDKVDKTPALGDQYFIDEGEDLTFDRVAEQVSEILTQLHEKKSTNAIDRAIDGLDAPIQALVRAHFKGKGLL